jgi:RNA polymerase sigma factor (sigma-70 family)
MRNPDNRVLERDLVSQVAEAVAGLPPHEREALVLAEYEGLKLYEIAAIVGADIRTVVARLESAQQRLRNALANHR